MTSPFKRQGFIMQRLIQGISNNRALQSATLRLEETLGILKQYYRFYVMISTRLQMHCFLFWHHYRNAHLGSSCKNIPELLYSEGTNFVFWNHIQTGKITKKFITWVFQVLEYFNYYECMVVIDKDTKMDTTFTFTTRRFCIEYDNYYAQKIDVSLICASP